VKTAVQLNALDSAKASLRVLPPAQNHTGAGARE